MSPFTHLVIHMIIGPEHDLLHISPGTKLDLLYFGTQIPLSKFSSIKQIVMSMGLTIGVTLLY